MNSRTSRPRSPIRPITLTEAAVLRAIMPSSVDLPTPEPAKMPRRWPRPQGITASSARTPSASRFVIGGRPSGLGGLPSTGTWCTPSVERALAVDRTAEAVDDASEHARADGRHQRAAGRDDLGARADPLHAGERHQERAAGAEADRLREHRLAAAGVADRADLADLDLGPVRLDDEADHLGDAAADAVGVGAPHALAVVAQVDAHRRTRLRARRTAGRAAARAATRSSRRCRRRRCARRRRPAQIAAVADQR